jgi:hypothetical protein
MSPVTVEGSPKTPLPMMEFTTSATRLQRPIARWRRSSHNGEGGLARRVHRTGPLRRRWRQKVRLPKCRRRKSNRTATPPFKMTRVAG